MDDLILALRIFQKYKDSYKPIHCEHDVLMIPDVSEERVSEEDKIILEDIGFFWASDYKCYISYRFGSG